MYFCLATTTVVSVSSIERNYELALTIWCKGLAATLQNIFVGDSFFSFSAMHDARDRPLYMYEEATVEAQQWFGEEKIVNYRSQGVRV